jgi:hypothetical protein
LYGFGGSVQLTARGPRNSAGVACHSHYLPIDVSTNLTTVNIIHKNNTIITAIVSTSITTPFPSDSIVTFAIAYHNAQIDIISNNIDISLLTGFI